MKTTVVVESLSYYKTNVLFQRSLQDFKILLDEITSEVQDKYKWILTNLHIANRAGNHSTTRVKLDTGAAGNLLLYCEFKGIFPNVSISDLAKMMKKNVTLEAYNKSEIKQLGMCRLTVMSGHHSRSYSFFVVPERCKPITGLADCASLGMVSINCPVTNSWSMPMSSDHEVDELDIDKTGVKTPKLMKVSLINDTKFFKTFHRCRTLAYQTS